MISRQFRIADQLGGLRPNRAIGPISDGAGKIVTSRVFEENENSTKVDTADNSPGVQRVHSSASREI